MPKLTLDDITGSRGSKDLLNNNFADIEAAIENTLSRDGTAPNAMSANLDMNGNRLINVAQANAGSDAVTYQQVLSLVSDVTLENDIVLNPIVERQVASASQTVFDLLTFTYATGANQIEVFVNGIRQTVDEDFTETDNNTITFTTGLNLNDEVVVVQNAGAIFNTSLDELDTAVTAAQTAQAAAETAETNAAASASAAATSETNAATSETSAANSASAAATSASNAATSESNAATSASNAATSESNAATSETNAAASAAAAAASLDEFDDTYLGSKASDPTLDNDGDALQDGALYFNTTSNELRVYDLGNTTWLSLPATELDGLSDVTLTSPSTGEILYFDGSVWINGTGADVGTVVDQDSDTGAASLPTGTTAQRPSTPSEGMFRRNSETSQFEGYTGTEWAGVGGASGGAGNPFVYENDTNVTADYTITSGKNAMSAGPITIDSGFTVTVPSGSVWTIV